MYGELSSRLTSASSSNFSRSSSLLLKGFNNMLNDFVPYAVSVCRFCSEVCSAVRGMSLRKVTSLGSNLASVTDLKRIQTQHSLCYAFGGYKSFSTRWSGGSLRVQV